MKTASRRTQSDSAERKALQRLSLPSMSIPIYAIGDVHGCLDALQALEEQIFIDAQQFGGQKLVIMLGDYVDRGPASSAVLDHLLTPMENGFTRLCLAGNHELMMLDYLEGRVSLEDWLTYGAEPTLLSYGIDMARLAAMGVSAADRDAMVRQNVPAHHLKFLRALPILVQTPDFTFVHAGYRPDMPLENQPDWMLATIRDAFYQRADACDRTVIHGHTPVEHPFHDKRRVNLDTGACFTGRLTGMRLWQNTGRFLSNLPGGMVRPAGQGRSSR